MASWMVHLRIADALLPHLGTVDKTAFIVGNIAPDSGVPNADWSAFSPPKSVSHFQVKTESGTQIDIDAFCRRYFCESMIPSYDLQAYSFFLGYYVHLLADIRWSEEIGGALKREYPKEYAEQKHALIARAKEDWYDLDFLYLEQHPTFAAFAVYEQAVGFENTFLEFFARDAFDDRRAYICGFYHGEEHGNLHREYRYLTPERADRFVRETAAWILQQESRFFDR